MKEAIPINFNVLKWARETLGLSLDDVSRIIKKSKDTIIEWETGKSSPTYPQLEHLAYHVYKRPVAVFFFPDVPDEQSPHTDFRTLPDLLLHKLPPEIIKLYRKAKVYQLNLIELYESIKPIENSLLDKFNISTNNNISSIADNVRKELGISIELQFSWQSKEIAFKEWRKVFESNGLFVFKDAFHNDDFSGFCLYNQKYPIIYVNNSMSISRQIFTLFHELGHLLFQTGGIDFRDTYNAKLYGNVYQNYEFICNKFANEILVPTDVFKKQNLQVSEANIQHLADSFSVSREVILRNYLELDLIDEIYYRKLVNKWIDENNKLKKTGSGRGHYYYTQISYLDNRYINLAFQKYYQERISIENLSEYLNVKIKNIPTFEHYILT